MHTSFLHKSFMYRLNQHIHQITSLKGMKWISLFRHNAYKARRQLTAIDWNFHINLSQAKTTTGDDVVTRKYNPRTRQWDRKVVKVEKEYNYIPILISKILKRRVDDDDVGGVTRAIDLNKSDPALISQLLPMYNHHLQRK